MSEEQRQVKVPPICEKHRSLLVHGSGFTPSDPWRVLEIVTNISLFQVASTQEVTRERIGKDITKMSELGCLACWSPDAFTRIVDLAARFKNGPYIQKIKEFGEGVIRAASKEGESDGQ